MLTEKFDGWIEVAATAGLTILIAVTVVVTVLLLRQFLSLFNQVRSKYVLLEITPAAFDDKPIEASSALFSALHSLGLARTLREKLLGLRHNFSVEIVSSRKGGVRYLARSPKSKIGTIKSTLKSYVPDAKVQESDEYLNDSFKTLVFGARKHYSYPLKQIDQLYSHDPIGYVTAAMNQLQDGEQMSLQISFSPRRLRSARRLRKKILRNDTFLPESTSGSVWLKPVVKIMHTVGFGVLDMVTIAAHPAETYPKYQSSDSKKLERDTRIARGEMPARQLSAFEHELIESISNKLKEPLHKVSLRATISTDSTERYQEKKDALVSAIGLYEQPEYQGLRLKKFRPLRAYDRFTVRERINISHGQYVSSTELANLFHFPHSESGKTEDVVESLSKTLPAPISLKGGNNLDIMIGVNRHHGASTQIGLTTDERHRHMYVIGGTGNGKTTMLKYQIVQDIQNGKGVAVVDPHGDLAEELLGYIPEHRMHDVIYLNPDDLNMPIGINLLELPEGLSGNDLLREKDRVTESAVSVLRKIFSEDDTGGHRIEYVLRNTIQTALTLEEANLFTIFRLLNDKNFRNKATSKLEDEDLKNFWKQELGKAGDMQRVKMAAGITAKIGRFLFSASARKMLEQNKSTISFEQIMDEQKILICNFSKGVLGEDTSALFGVTILAKLQLASLRRAMQKEDARKPYYLYVDEFQNFATMGFVQMLSEARKYRLFLTMAEQSTQQQDDQQLVEQILANVGTVVAFRSGSPADERFVLPLFEPYISKGEIANLPAYNYYCRISAIKAQEPMSGETLLLDTEPNETIAEKVKNYSRTTYGTKFDKAMNSPTSATAESTPRNKPKKPINSSSKTKARKRKAISARG